MMISAFDLFKVGIGPSSSHTVGPMRAACSFVLRLREEGLLTQVARVRCELFGSLGATGHGHGSVKAVVLGLEGERPELVDPATAEPRLESVRRSGTVSLAGEHPIPFAVDDDVVLHRRRRLEFHSNGMLFRAMDAQGDEVDRREYYSVGGGFVLDEDEAGRPVLVEDSTPVRYPFRTGQELLEHTRRSGLRISDIMLANELSWRSEPEVRGGLLHVWSVMQECVDRGTRTPGVLPGGLKVRRRAAALRAQLEGRHDDSDPLRAMEWVTLYALAVNEENAAGGRVVTAPTNGAAGIVPAVLHYYRDFIGSYSDDGVVRFLLTATAIGLLFKENAAEIGIEHNLGLTCDPVGGLVQIPCIERNAVGSIKAITAARMAVRGDGRHHVPLDKAIKTMRETGADMKDKYKETARGGLALNIVEC